MVARTSLTLSMSTSDVNGIRDGTPYTPMIADANLESMHAAHRVKRTVCPCFTYAVVTIRTLPFCTWRLHRPLQSAREVGAIDMWYAFRLVFIYPPGNPYGRRVNEKEAAMSRRTPHLRQVAVVVDANESRLAYALAAGRQHHAVQTAHRKTLNSIDQSIDSAILKANTQSALSCSRRPMESVVLAVLGPPMPMPAAVAADVKSISDRFAQLNVFDQESTDANTGKRKMDGSLAAARVGQTTTERWSNERFRQVMLLVLEFRMEWPNQSLISDDDVTEIRSALDGALFIATSTNAV